MQRLQRRWRSFWRHSRNSLTMAGPAHAPPAIGRRPTYLMPISFCISSHSQHEPGSIVLAQMTWVAVQIVRRGPLLVIDHRINA